MKIISIFFLSCFIIFPGFSETMYIYTYEVCNDEPVPFEMQAKEGILDGLFDAGHIVFDDISDSENGNFLSRSKIDTLIMDAKKGGAYYLVAAQITTSTKSLENNSEYIESTALYYLYDVTAGTLIQKGKTIVNNINREDQINKENLWFQLGLFISEEITNFYNIRKKVSG